MSGPLRILHVVVNMNRGGAETLLMNLYRNMERSQVQFDFLTCKPGVFDSEIKQMGGTVHRIPYVSDIGHFKFIKELKSFFKEHKYLVIHSHLDKMSGLILKEACQAGIPVRIAHSHNTSSEGGLFAKLYKNYIGNAIQKNATSKIACSQAASQWLFGDVDQTCILNNGIILEDFSFDVKTRKKIRSELNVPEECVLVGHIGRFNEQKNHTFLLEIFAELHQQHPNTKLVLVGDGDLRQTMEEKATHLNLEHAVLFLGVRGDVPDILQAFDLMVFPSLHEGLPLTLVEAQAAGVPCLISDAITNEIDLGLDLITNESLASDPTSWSQKIMDLNRRTDRQLLKQIKQAGFDIVDTANWLQDFYISELARLDHKFSKIKGA